MVNGINLLSIGKPSYRRFFSLNNKVSITNINTAKLKTMNKEVCQERLKEYKNGDLKAREDLIMGNLKLILSVIKKINYPSNIDPDDLFQIGCIGLMKAIDNFNIELNVAFSTYAIPMIIGEIKRYIRDHSNLKISRQIRDLAYKILKCKDQFVVEHKREPTCLELAKILNVDAWDIYEALNSINCVVSLQDPIFNDNGDSLSYQDQISDTYDIIEKITNKATLKDGINQLESTQKKVILARYYHGMTQEEIAHELFISQAQVSRLEKCAINHLKKLF